MNARLSKLTIQTLFSCSVFAIAMPALADSTWSNLGTSCGDSATHLSNGVCGTQSGVALNASGVSAASGTTFAAASLYNWGSNGLGVVNGSEDATATGPHAADNISGTDAIQLKFGTAVTLKSLTIGWNGTDNPTSNSTGTYNDSDLSVLAWMGAGAPPASSSLGGAGWQLVGNYADVGASAGNTAAVSSAIYSSYWLISAYSSAFGGNASTNLGNGNDAFKLTGISVGSKPSGNVPEPGSIALIGAGLFSLFFRSRRKQATSV